MSDMRKTSRKLSKTGYRKSKRTKHNKKHNETHDYKRKKEKEVNNKNQCLENMAAKIKHVMAGGVSQVVECLPNRHEALCAVCSIREDYIQGKPGQIVCKTPPP
jgi:hypothetical protein